MATSSSFCMMLVCWVKSSSTRKSSCRSTASTTLGMSLRTSWKMRSNGPGIGHLCSCKQHGRELGEEAPRARILRALVIAHLAHANGVVDERGDVLRLDCDGRGRQLAVVLRHHEVELEENVGPHPVH